jgi:uncharacterized protein (TIGR00251 family)
MKASENASTLVCNETNDGVTFTIHVQPRASRNEICGIHGGELKVRLTAPPVDDAANRLCVEFLAKRLDISKSQVVVVNGHKSRHKLIRISGIDRRRLLQLLAEP